MDSLYTFRVSPHTWGYPPKKMERNKHAMLTWQELEEWAEDMLDAFHAVAKQAHAQHTTDTEIVKLELAFVGAATLPGTSGVVPQAPSNELLDATIRADRWGKIFEGACTLWATYCPLFDAYVILDNYPALEKVLREATTDLITLVRKAGFPTRRPA